MDFSTKFTVRTDLADESVEFLGKKRGRIGDGIVFDREKFGTLTADKVTIENEMGEKISGKPAGTYFTLAVGEVWKDDGESFEQKAMAVGECLKGMLPQGERYMAVCLGNDRIIADALGPFAAKSIIVTRHIKQNDKKLFDSLCLGEVSCVIPGVMGDTGAEAAEIVSGVCQKIRPDAVIVIDALAGKSLDRLCRTVQITNSGICPGSGVGNDRRQISERTLGVPVIAMGVPTVVDSFSLCIEVAKRQAGEQAADELRQKLDGKTDGFFVCPKETDKIVRSVSRLVAYGINFALHSPITTAEMDEFLA